MRAHTRTHTHTRTLRAWACGAFLRASRCVRFLENSWSNAAHVAATSPCGAMLVQEDGGRPYYCVGLIGLRWEPSQLCPSS